MKKSPLQHKLESLELKTELTTPERENILALAELDGFLLLLGYLAAEQQGHRIQLTYLNLEDAGQRRTASVIQGKIQGIDRVRETMLELLAPDNTAPATEKN